MYFTHAMYCKGGSWQFCVACGSKICACAGTARGSCPHCVRGFLSNYYKLGQRCGYSGCKKAPVASSPRVGQVCLRHAFDRGGYRAPTPDDSTATGTITPYSLTVLRALDPSSLAPEIGIMRRDLIKE